jgi:TctA family transporter
VDLIEGLVQALQGMQSWAFALAFVLGCLNGVIFGVLPGLSGSVGIALMIPFTYSMGATEAMALFVAALSGQTFAGSVSAILLNTPGTSPNAATTFDGYPLARKGRGGFAIGISATSSFLGSLVGVAVLIALFPLMRGIILAFSFPEFTMLGVLGLAAIAVAARGSMLKGLISGLVGLVISFVGFAPIGGDIRYVFGQAELYDGIGIVPVLIGLFAITEALRLLTSNQSVAKDVDALRFGRSQVWEGVVYTVKKPFLVLRSSLLGTGIGIVPAVGGTLAAFLAYFQAAKTVKDPKFGTGDPRGVVAPESANDAKDAGAALPTLAFGIPGSADWAIILGAMVIHGVTPGPNLIKETPDIVWTAILVILGASLVSSLIGIIAAPKLIQVTRLRPSLLAPIVIVLAVTGAFGLELRVTDVVLALGFGFLGYAMKQVGMPVIPLILGLILGPMVERSFSQSLSIFGGPSIFVTRPISLVLVLLTVGIIVYEVIAGRRERKKNPRSIDEGVQEAIRPRSLALIGGMGATAAIAFVIALDFTPESRRFPLLTAGLLAVFAAVYLSVAAVPWLRRRLGGLIADGGGMEQMAARVPEDDDLTPSTVTGADLESEPGDPGLELAVRPKTTVTTEQEFDEEDLAPGKRLLKSVILLVALALGTLLVGLAVAVPIILVLFFRFVGRESWRLTTVLTVGTLIVLYIAFVSLLGVPLEGGLLLPY